ncbi:MAG: glycoside hydrolase family 5 protein [Lachnospiraceae bacterium]|nr:glycoside hydrolase family 5 protein [Lachnospiraceae bacterium]
MATPAPVQEAMRDITTMELVRDMGIGINLGNTFESCGSWINSSKVKNYETGWGSPVITEKMIAGYKEAGFGVLRIPVAWSNMMLEDYTIHPDYLARVKEVVTWAIDNDLYVILNIHWDSGWWTNFPTDKEECMYKYVRIWTQLSEEFGEFSDYLMFEALNEEGCWDSVWNRWGGTTGKAEAYGLLNEINQTFVDTVRASGGNNAKRHLLIAGYATDIDLTCDAMFELPEDPAGRIAVSVHYYTPSTFCILEQDADWGKAKADWGSASDVQELTRNMDKLKTTFIDKGIPVIIGEYGVAKKNKTEEVVRLFLSSVCEEAYERQICPVLWDVTSNFYNRSKCEMYDKQLQKELLSVLE